MMITTEVQYVYLLIVANSVVLAVACYCLSRFEQRCRQIEDFWASPTGSAVSESGRDDSREQMRITQRLEKRVGELQRTVKVMEIKKTQSAPTAVQAVERNLPIENAVRMARLGASISDLTKSCGLNIGEARLMQKLHGNARTAVNGK